jgi:hypothetical protein
MRTKIMTKIDNIEIIIGIGDPPSDPEATKKAASDLLADTDIAKSVTVKKGEYFAANIKRAAAIDAYYAAKTEREKNVATADYKDALAKMELINSELCELDKSYTAKYKEILEQNPVYAIPSPDETIITDAEADKILTKLVAATNNGKRLKSDLTEISDYRGAVVWECKNGVWQYRQIVTLGDEPTKKETLQENLTKAQIDEIKSQAK